MYEPIEFRNVNEAINSGRLDGYRGRAHALDSDVTVGPGLRVILTETGQVVALVKLTDETHRLDDLARLGAYLRGHDVPPSN